MKDKVFITTAIDYANDVIHIGHAYEKVLADAYARYQRMIKGKDSVLYTTGTDEHGTTNQKSAEEKGLTPKEHVKQVSLEDKKQIDSLNVSYDRFIRTTDEDHVKTAEKFFQKVSENGDIYKGTYKGYYCEGCEAHKTLSELTEDKQCPNHPTREIQVLNEENYFFKWSKYNDFLKDIILKNELVVLPEGKRKEMLAFLENGLKDITVSRPRYKVSWGIATPKDPEQVIYVWFDALINYLTAGRPLGFWDENTEIVHFVGKDIARWHVLLWPAMLKSAGYRLPDKIYVHGFINLEGQKISKSTGNIIRPTDLVEKYGVDAVRYYLLKFGPVVEDSDISEDHFIEIYNADLANSLGNTVARLTKLAEKSELEFELSANTENIWTEDLKERFSQFRVDLVLAGIWSALHDLDKHINENEPWAITNKDKLHKVLSEELGALVKVAYLIKPFLPETADKIISLLSPTKIKAGKSLFPRVQ